MSILLPHILSNVRIHWFISLSHVRYFSLNWTNSCNLWFISFTICWRNFLAAKIICIVSLLLYIYRTQHPLLIFSILVNSFIGFLLVYFLLIMTGFSVFTTWYLPAFQIPVLPSTLFIGTPIIQTSYFHFTFYTRLFLIWHFPHIFFLYS